MNLNSWSSSCHLLSKRWQVQVTTVGWLLHSVELIFVFLLKPNWRLFSYVCVCIHVHMYVLVYHACACRFTCEDQKVSFKHLSQLPYILCLRHRHFTKSRIYLDYSPMSMPPYVGKSHAQSRLTSQFRISGLHVCRSNTLDISLLSRYNWIIFYI